MEFCDHILKGLKVMTLQQFNIYPILTPCRLAATVNVAGVYFNGPTNNGVKATLTVTAGVLTIDGVIVLLGDRVLLQNQTNAFENGIYICTVQGALGVSAILQRADDYQNIEQIRAGQSVNIGAGLTNAGSIWVTIEPLPAHLGIDALTFAAAPAAGLGTIASQNANAVAITGGTITGITDLAVADGGTGASTGPLALTNLGVRRATTAAFAGGGTTNAFAAVGVVATDKVTANILASTNNVALTKLVPGAGILTATFSADPGAGTTLNWVAMPA